MDIDCQYIIPSDAEELKKRHEAEEFLQSYKGNQYKKQDNVS